MQGVPPSNASGRPEDELERLTKKMLYDMDNPPSEEYFGESARGLQALRLALKEYIYSSVC